MRASRSLQEAFNLRSTVAVLGFAIRTLAQMLEEGKLDELVAQSRANNSQGSNRSDEGRQGSRNNRFDDEKKDFNRERAKANPFARPEKPQPNEADNKQTEANQSDENQNSDGSQNSESEISDNELNSTEEKTDLVETTNELEKNNSQESSES